VLIAGATLRGRDGRFDVRCSGGRIAEVVRRLSPRPGEARIEARGGALLPGLHDHHMHVFAQAAADASVHCGPPQVHDEGALQRAIDGAPEAVGHAAWIRGVAYHESVAGALDRGRLDELCPDRPLRLQHRSGKLWMLNTAALRAQAIDGRRAPAGLELDAAGHPTGRLFRLDDWLARRMARAGAAAPPQLAALSQRLASVGVTGVTDTSPHNGPAQLAAFVAAAATGWRQRLRVMGDDALPPVDHPRICRGERKVLLDEDRLPAWEDLARVFSSAHEAGRAVAVHCVTAAELVLTLAVLREVGAREGDRIEHASVVPPEVISLLCDSGVRVVTQPGFIAARGDQYLCDVDAADHDNLYRCRSLLEAGVRVAGSTDAPYSEPDPWAAMRAAVSRRTDAGAVIGARECLDPEQALALFLSAAGDAGGAPRRIEPGAAADLCLLDRPWPEARQRLLAADVLATVCAGELIYQRSGVRHDAVA